MTDTLKMAREALEIGRACAAEVAQRLHTELAGYRQHKHDAADADVATIAAAIAAIDAQAPQAAPTVKRYCCYGAAAEVGCDDDCPTKKAPQAAPVRAEPEFTDNARAALLWVLWHHQGGSSPVGQPLRYALGMGAHQPLTAEQVAAAKAWAALTRSTTAEFHAARATPPQQAAPVGWLRAIDEALVTSHLDVANADDPYDVAKEKLNRLLALEQGIGAYFATPPQQAATVALAPFDFVAHIRRHMNFSLRTFGPGARAEGVVDHIRKELREIEAAPHDLEEWIDVLMLALDGAWRSGASPDQIVAQLVAKQTKNEGRKWPDWRTVPAGKAIEHDRTGEAGAAAQGGEHGC